MLTTVCSPSFFSPTWYLKIVFKSFSSSFALCACCGQYHNYLLPNLLFSRVAQEFWKCSYFWDFRSVEPQLAISEWDSIDSSRLNRTALGYFTHILAPIHKATYTHSRSKHFNRSSTHNLLVNSNSCNQIICKDMMVWISRILGLNMFWVKLCILGFIVWKSIFEIELNWAEHEDRNRKRIAFQPHMCVHVLWFSSYCHQFTIW